MIRARVIFVYFIVVLHPPRMTYGERVTAACWISSKNRASATVKGYRWRYLLLKGCPISWGKISTSNPRVSAPRATFTGEWIKEKQDWASEIPLWPSFTCLLSPAASQRSCSNWSGLHSVAEQNRTADASSWKSESLITWQSKGRIKQKNKEPLILDVILQIFCLFK